MKKYRFINLVIVFLVLAGVTSCDEYLDVNTDPNNPTEVTPDLVLPVGQVFTAAYMHGDRRASHLGNMFMYNWSESQGFSWYNDEFAYLVTTTFYARLFDNAYSDALKQYQILVNLEDPVYNNYIAIGKIMKSYHFQLLVDFYGDVPYFEALQRKANATPVYDDAQAVYNDLLVQLTDAISLIKAAAADNTSEEPGTDDAMFGGDMTEWIRFANTIKVRILTRMSDVAATADISAELAAIEAEGSGFITGDVAINPGFVDEENKQNPFWAAFGAGPDGTNTLTNNATCATQYILDYLNSTSDPRIDYLYEEPATGHLGVEQGVEPGPAFAPDFVSNIGPGLLIGADQGSTIFTVAENYFNLAELALKELSGDDPEALYNAGVEASFDFLEAPDYDAYIAQLVNNVNYGASANKLQAIITQKWIAVNGVTAEQSWFDYNRTGFPASLPISNEASTSDRPVRLFYPASELSSNATNVPSQPNAFTQKIFWAN